MSRKTPAKNRPSSTRFFHSAPPKNIREQLFQQMENLQSMQEDTELELEMAKVRLTVTKDKSRQLDIEERIAQIQKLSDFTEKGIAKVSFEILQMEGMRPERGEGLKPGI